MENEYGTLSQTINALKEQGYYVDFNMHNNCLICHQSPEALSPSEFEIDAIFRYEGDTDPGDESILYAISSPQYKVKGLLVNAFGIYAENDSAVLVQKLHRAHLC